MVIPPTGCCPTSLQKKPLKGNVNYIVHIKEGQDPQKLSANKPKVSKNRCFLFDFPYLSLQQGNVLFFRTKWLWRFFEFKALKRIEHFKISHYSLPLLWSPVVVIHKALRYKLTCSVDHIISQPILICCRMGVREGKDTKRSLKDKNIELISQNVWNTQTLTDDWLMRSPV